jgi:eukaryotic-like serine/threonine-protein kinase
VTTAERVPTVPGLTGLTVLARGGYATVYRAVQESLGREVAVKVENRTLESERDRRRFLREARAAGRMSSHPHVVDLFDAGVTADSRPYLIMELCRGNFADWMKETPLSAAEARDVGVKIADALSDAHSLGVLHRDVKPANILLSDFGEPVLADFGLAILTESRDLSITLDVLTPAYAPPEMFRHGPPAPTADVYSLCATLYALMAGRPPRWTAGGRDPSLVSLVDMFEEPIPDLPGVPASLLVLLRRGMSNVESERPTASELRDELLALELGALPPSELETLSASGASAPPAPTSRDSDGPATVTAPVAGLPRGRRGLPRGRRGLRRRPPPILLWSVAVGLYLLTLAALVALALYLAPEPASTRFVQPAPAPVACPLAPAGAAHCVTAAECFDAVTVTGGVATARTVACADPHLWEVFAIGQLPEALVGARQAQIKQNDQVRRICNATNARNLDSEATWQVEVLPPSPDEIRSGDRAYRCLAGRPPAKLTGSRFLPP